MKNGMNARWTKSWWHFEICVIILNRMGKIAKYLNQLIVGNVFDAPEILEDYATDGSALRVKPKFVAFPESTEDIQKLMRFFDQLASQDIKVAVTVRGNGRGEGGESLTNGIIISTEKLNKMLEIDPRERLVHVQSGITLKELNTALSTVGLTIPIDGHDDDTIGGLISNCPVDTSARKYGGIANYVEKLEVVLANGDCIQTGRLKKYAIAKKAVEKTSEGKLYQRLSKLAHDNNDFIKSLSDDEHSMAGYPMLRKAFRRETLDMMPLFFGAQGTLGIISEIILRAIPLRKQPSRVVATFREIGPAVRFMDFCLSMKPRRLDVFDLKIIQDARESGKNLDGVIRKLENGFVVYANFDERGAACLRKIEGAKTNFPRTAKFILESPETIVTIEEFENSLAGYLGFVRNGERVPILTDFYLPARNLGTFLDDLVVLGDKLGLDLALYGSYANSIYNLRPKFKLDDPEFNKKAATFLKAGAYIIDRQDGELAGGGPEGRLKAIVTNAEMKEDAKNVYTTLKEIFDSSGILNPDVKLGATSKFTLTHFRK